MKVTKSMENKEKQKTPSKNEGQLQQMVIFFAQWLISGFVLFFVASFLGVDMVGILLGEMFLPIFFFVVRFGEI